MKQILSFTILITMMNQAHSFLYLIHDEALNDSVLFTIDSPYDTETLNYYPGYDIEALAAHPEKWELYAASGDDTEKAGFLYQVNPQSGDLTEIGSTGFKEIEGLSFKADGTLWGWSKGDGLIKVNLQTAESELILPSEVEIEALTWKDEKVLYLAQGTDLWKYDGQYLELACDISKHTQGKSIEALEMAPNNTLLVGLHGKRSLLQLNVLSIEPCFILKSREIASEHNDIEGIAYTKIGPLNIATPGIGPNSTIYDILKPSISTNIDVSTGVSAGGSDNRDIPTLFLEEITPVGPITVTQLYDDGTHGDLQANDYLYMGQFVVQKMVEGEYCYQVRTGEPVAGIELVTDSNCLWVVSLPMQHVPSEILVDEGVMVIFTKDTSVLRIKEIILTEGAMVLEDLPFIRGLVVRMESEHRANIIARFEKYPEVRLAIPEMRGTPAEGSPNNNPEGKLGFSRPMKLTFVGNSFESNLETNNWQISGSCFNTSKLGNFTPTSGEKFLVCTTYPFGKTAWIKREIDIPSDTTSLSISFDYNIITQENTTSLNDMVRLSLVNPDGKMTPLVANVGDIPMFNSTLTLPEGEMAIKQTGWQTASVEIPVTGRGKGFLSIIIHSENDPSIGGFGEGNNRQSALLVDNIQITYPE